MKLSTTPTAPEGFQPATTQNTLAAIHNTLHRLIDELGEDFDMSSRKAMVMAVEALGLVRQLDGELDELLNMYEALGGDDAYKAKKGAQAAE